MTDGSDGDPVTDTALADRVAAAAAALREEATAVGERRLLVLAGERAAGYRAAEAAIAGAGVDRRETTLVGERAFLDCERVSRKRADALLGTTREAVVLDAHDAFDPNALGRTVGAVDGGGLLVLVVPSLTEWPDRRDAFDESLVVPPSDLADVTGHFRRRVVETLRAHPGVAIVDVDAATVERDGLTHPAPRRPASSPTPPAEHAFPAAAYAACRTQDQADCLAAFERLRESGNAVVVEADRGRGKSSAAGLAAGALAAEGRDVLVTAPDERNARELFARARELLADLDSLADRSADPPLLVAASGRGAAEDAVAEEGARGRVRFLPPAEAGAASADVRFVDEAAALPVGVLESFLDGGAIGFTTTVHGYEGAGRGFAVRFRDRLAESTLTVSDVALVEPIRYAAGDPVEVWAFRALLLDARPPVDPLVADARPATVEYGRPDAEALLADEHRLREAFGGLVAAHYRTEPADLARLLDAPNLTVRTLEQGGHVVCVALLAREGSLPAEVRRGMYEGERVRGNMLPDVLTSQLRDEEAGIPAGLRVLRIATHPAVRSRGLGSHLLGEVRREFGHLDWLGVGYGATPSLLSFWAANGFSTVHLSTTRNDASGEYSALMLAPLSGAGEALQDRHARWFGERVADVLADPLDDADPDVVRMALAATETTIPLDLSDRDWRVVAGAAYGPGLYDAAPGPFRRLALRALVDADGPDLTPRQERLLVRKVLQARSWSTAADDLGYHSTSQCMRALGEAYRPVVDAYGTEAAREERDRYVDREVP